MVWPKWKAWAATTKLDRTRSNNKMAISFVCGQRRNRPWKSIGGSGKTQVISRPSRKPDTRLARERSPHSSTQITAVTIDIRSCGRRRLSVGRSTLGSPTGSRGRLLALTFVLVHHQRTPGGSTACTYGSPLSMSAAARSV